MFLGVRAVGCCFLTATVPCGMCRVWSVPHLAGDWRVVHVLVAPQCLPSPLCHMSPVINVANIYGFIGPCPAAGGRRVHIASRGHMRGVAGAPELRGMQPGAGHVRMQPHNLSGSTAS